VAPHDGGVSVPTAAPRERDPAFASRLALTILAVLVLWPGLRLTEFHPAILFDPTTIAVTGRFLATFFPPRLDPEFLTLVFRSTLETLALATAGLALALAIAVPISLAVSRSLSISRIGPARKRWLGVLLRAPARWLLVVLRSVPEIVWALLFVRAVGLGPTAGVLAIAINYAGMLGKVFFEIYESGDTRPARAILEAGGGRTGAFCYGILPVAAPELVSYSVYRWECAVRTSVVMGFIGAGGLGQQMELSIKMLNGGEVATMLLVFLLLVLFADAISAALRRVFA
jgi:phosphonate transport system permease protein